MQKLRPEKVLSASIIKIKFPGWSLRSNTGGRCNHGGNAEVLGSRGVEFDLVSTGLR